MHLQGSTCVVRKAIGNLRRSEPIIPGTDIDLHVDATTIVLLGNAQCSTHIHVDHAEAVNIGFLIAVSACVWLYA